MMLREFLHRLTAGVMIILLPAAVLSADAGTAMLTSGKKVLVNGKQVQGRQAIMPGDTVQNEDASVAMLAVPGATVGVGAHSSVVYGNDGIRVTSGAANLRAQSKMTASYDEITVRPMGDDAQFVVGEISGKRMIAALHGSVLVADGDNEVVLAEGKALTQDTRPTPPLKGKDVKSDTTKTGEEPRGGKRRRGLILPGWAEAAIIGGTIAGVFGGLAAAGYFDKPVASHP